MVFVVTVDGARKRRMAKKLIQCYGLYRERIV